MPVYSDSDFDDAPLIGEGSAPVKPFRLAVTHASEGPRVEFFRAYAEADAGSLIAMQRARNEMQQAQAAAGLIFAAMVDDDGLSADYVAPEADEDRRAEIEARLAELAELSDDLNDAGREELRRLLEEAAAMEPDPRLEDRAQWSSKRRFEAVMNDPMQRVRPSALTDLSQLIIGATTGRPTRRSGSSSAGPGGTRRG